MSRIFTGAQRRHPGLGRQRLWAALRALTFGSVLGLAACGGGGSGGIDGTGAQKDIQSYGSITAFGSVWVNGVEFETGSATIRIDDNPHPESDLKLGMVVQVEGRSEDRAALSIEVEDALKGRVEQVLDAARMVVMGQTVQIDTGTRFDNGVVPGVGDYVEVHGLAVSSGVVSAGYIERKTTLATPPFVVKGFVSAHDSSAKRLTIGSLTVDYASATVNDLPAGSWVGRLVTAKGSSCDGNPICTRLVASKVEPTGARLDDTIARAELEGFVTALTTDGFVLGGQAVRTSSSTSYEGGTSAEVVVGAKLEVEGSLSGGVLVASKVSWRDNLRIEADVASFDAGSGDVTLVGLNGLVVRVNALTELDKIAQPGDLAVGQHLRLKARPGLNGTVQALELEVRDADSRIEFRAPVTSRDATAGTLQLQGVGIDTSSVSEFRLLDGTLVNRATFLGSLSLGQQVKARGSRSGSTVVWERLEREN